MITRLSLVPDKDHVAAAGSLANLHDHNARRQQEAAARTIAAVHDLRKRGAELGIVETTVANARISYPDLTYEDLAAVTGLNPSAVARAIWHIETKARLAQQAA